MKKIFTAIMLLITMIGNNSICMDAEDLLKNDGIKLQKLVASERIGFTPGVHTAEITLENFFNNHPMKDLKKTYNEKTLKQAQLIADRVQYKDKLFAIIEKEDEPRVFHSAINMNQYILTMQLPKKGSLLHQAVLFERPKCVKRFLALEANPNCVDIDGSSPLHQAIKNNVRIDIIKDLLLAGADIDSLVNQKHNSSFDLACAEHSPSVTAFEPYGYCFFSSSLAEWRNTNPHELLKNDGKCLKKLANGPIGSREWRLATDALEKFFKHINNSSSYEAPIRKAYVNKHGFILKHASRAQAEDLFGKETLAYAEKTLQERSHIIFRLLSSTECSDHEVVKHLIETHPISRSLQYEMLNICINNADNECLLLCLDNGFDPNRYQRKISLLHYAVQCKNSQAITLLSQYNPDLMIKNHEDKTPLDLAISLGDTECKKAMERAIQDRIRYLKKSKKPCDLVKHMIKNPEPHPSTKKFKENKSPNLIAQKNPVVKYKREYCAKCVSELTWHLEIHKIY